MRPLLFGIAALATLALSGHQSADTIAFDLKDPKGVTGMSLSIDAPLEPVRGFAGGVSGSLSLNLSEPSKSTGKVVVDAKSTRLGSDALTEAMHQNWCMDVAKYPTIEFVVKKVDEITKEGDNYKAKVTGDFTFHGVTKPLSIEATVKHLPGKLKQRGGTEKDGDLVQIHSKFSFNRIDFGVAPDLNTDLIGNKVDVDLAVTGVAFK